MEARPGTPAALMLPPSHLLIPGHQVGLFAVAHLGVVWQSLEFCARQCSAPELCEVGDLPFPQSLSTSNSSTKRVHGVANFPGPFETVALLFLQHPVASSRTTESLN